MNLYNCYEGVQLKVAHELSCAQFTIGDEVDIPDGVYVGYEGVIVVHHGRLLQRYPHVITKWGDVVEPHSLLEHYHLV